MEEPRSVASLHVEADGDATMGGTTTDRSADVFVAGMPSGQEPECPCESRHMILSMTMTISRHRLCSGQRVLVGIMALLGVGTLLPFNVFITERTFYEVSAAALSSNYAKLLHPDVAHTRRKTAPAISSKPVLANEQVSELQLMCMAQVRARQPPTWRAAADNFENLLVLVFQLWCAGQQLFCQQHGLVRA